MGSRGRPLFDLNEPPIEDDEETDRVIYLQPQKAHPLPTQCTDTSNLVASVGAQAIKNNHAFSHAPSGSGFQPFVRPKADLAPDVSNEQGNTSNENTKSALLQKADETKATVILPNEDANSEEREEGEWSDAEANVHLCKFSHEHSQDLKEDGGLESMKPSASITEHEGSSFSANVIMEHGIRSQPLSGTDGILCDQKSNTGKDTDGNSDMLSGCLQETVVVPKPKEAKGVEANHALRIASNVGKRKLDQQKEAMLGKKRNRQTMMLNIDEVKQAGTHKTLTPKRKPTTVRTVKELRNLSPSVERAAETPSQPLSSDQKPDSYGDLPVNEGSACVESSQPKVECNYDMTSG